MVGNALTEKQLPYYNSDEVLNSSVDVKKCTEVKRDSLLVGVYLWKCKTLSG